MRNRIPLSFLLVIGLLGSGGYTPTTQAAGVENHDIAHRLNSTESTVGNHSSRILSKLYAKHRTEAVAMARREGLIE